MLILQNVNAICDIAGLNEFSGKNLGHLFSEMLDCCIRVCKSQWQITVNIWDSRGPVRPTLGYATVAMMFICNYIHT